MKILFLKDVKGRGKKGEVKDVPDGYAQNFLLPTHSAEIPTPAALARIKQQTDTVRVTKEVKDDLLERYLKEVDGQTVTFTLKTNEHGHLFSSITPRMVADALLKRRITIAPEAIFLPEHIKEVGEYQVKITMKNKTAEIKVVVEKE